MIDLDRFEIEAVGQNPAKLAAAIHQQLGPIERPVPVADIAYGLDIRQIETRSLNGCEGALIMPRNKSKGSIAVKKGARSDRVRFTIAHELGHFINSGHLPPRTSDGVSFGFECKNEDLRVRVKSGHNVLTLAQRKEVEANQFAAELLMPKYSLTPHLKRAPNLERVLDIAKTLDVSREAAANRYVTIHDHPIAIVFSKNNRIRYIAKKDEFPRTLIWNRERLPHTVANARNGLTDIIEAETDVWLARPETEYLDIQTLGQANGYQMTLLILPDTEGEPAGIESSFDRFDRLR